MKDNIDDSDTFYLGLTMAGAVSAGCYTAGAMDYLFEILDLWERAKDKGNPLPGIDINLVPRHKVVIDAMGGASAGGMVTVMSAIYALEGKVNPVREVPEDDSKSYNILYDNWVYLDDKNGHTFKQLWDTDDLEDGEKLMSIFNTKVIDSIAQRAFTFDGERRLGDQLYAMKPYVSKKLEMLLSHSMLRGIPLDVDFNSPIAPEEKNIHTTYEHFMVSHFRFSAQDKDFSSGYLELDPYDRVTGANMKASTIATGAFPVGLKYRALDYLNDCYLQSTVNRIVSADYGLDKVGEIEHCPINFKTFSVDGGAINNEPYSEVMSILKHRHETKAGQFKKYGLVMIDPFPDRSTDDKEYKHPKDLIDAVPRIVKMLWNQSKVKRAETLADYNNEYRGEIYPSRKRPDGTSEDYPIASGSFMAFGGFLDIKFRKYDFFLGRDNARNFYRYFFSLPYFENEPEKNHPIHRDPYWTQEMIEKFKIDKPEGENIPGSFFLPIIPDMNMILDKEKYSCRQLSYTIKERPVYSAEELFNIEPKMRKRIAMILDKVKYRFTNPEEKEETEEEINAKMISDAWMHKYYGGKSTGKLKLWIGNVMFKYILKGRISKMLSKAMIRMILFDLAKRNLLKHKND